MTEMPTTYDFEATEERLYKWWRENGWFKPEIASPDAPPFVISMPPPNVTGALHTGHAITASLEDLMIRYHRMRGLAALWVPGSDHAGIATQLVVERALAGRRHQPRSDRPRGVPATHLGLEKDVRRIASPNSTAAWGLHAIGTASDSRWTTDLSRAVREAFVRLYNMGLIYRGEYLINWSPGLQTAVSDLEVEYSEEPGKLYYFKYPIAGAARASSSRWRPPAPRRYWATRPWRFTPTMSATVT